MTIEKAIRMAEMLHRDNCRRWATVKALRPHHQSQHLLTILPSSFPPYYMITSPTCTHSTP